MTEVLKNSPLIETVCEVRFAGEPAVESRRDEFFEAIRTEFPKVFVPILKEGEAPALSPYTYKSVEESEWLNVAINKFSLITFKYPGFEAFRLKFLKYFRIFCEKHHIKKLNRFGLRYIDHIPILRERGKIPITNYLNFGFEMPQSIPKEYNDFGTVLVTEIGEGTLRILVQYQQLPDPQKTEIIVLDFDYYLTENLTSERIEEYLEISHKHTKQIFLDIIAEKYMRVIKGE